MPGWAGGAEQRHQPRRLEPLALARADDQTEVRKEQQDKAVQERDTLIAVIDPEQRFADALGEEQPDGATEESAEQLRDGGDRKSTRLNSSHSQISYAVFCLK